MKTQIEIFTAKCPVCDPVVKMVNEVACQNCEITTFDLIAQCEDKICLSKLEEYGIKKVPAIAVNGKLLDCCRDSTITRDDLINAGIGQV